MTSSIIFENKIYEKSDFYITRKSSKNDYYSNKEKIPDGYWVVVQLNQCPSYTVSSVVIYSPLEVKPIKIDKHFNKHQFSTPIQYKPDFFEFGGVSAKGYFYRRLFYIDESGMDVKVWVHKQFIPLTPRSITWVAKSKKLTYTDYLYKINKDKNATIFNLYNGIELSIAGIDEIT